jgi:hypothetical protein
MFANSEGLSFLDHADSLRLNCKVVPVNKSWVHPVNETLHESRTVSLIPDMSTATMILYGQCLPTDVYQEPWEDRNPAGHKLWAMVQYPVAHFALVTLCRGNHFVPENHLHVISSITEEYLLNKKPSIMGLLGGGNKVEVIIYPNLSEEQKETLERYSGILST